MRQWACRSRTNTDDRLPRASFGRAEGGDAIVESCDGADVRPQSSVPHSLDDRTQLGTIGLDNEVDRQAQAAVLEQSCHWRCVSTPRWRRTSASSHQAPT